jgi:hypothetical protein
MLFNLIRKLKSKKGKMHIRIIEGKKCSRCQDKTVKGRYRPLVENKFRQKWICTSCEEKGH